MKAPGVVRGCLSRHPRERASLLDVCREVQGELGWLPPEAITEIAVGLDVPRVDVEGVASFYAFLARTPRGKIVIRLCDDVSDRIRGYDRVRDSFQKALGIGMGETTPDGLISLTRTACIGMSDQAPAALVNDVPVTELSTDRAWSVVRELRMHGDPLRLIDTLGDGNNAHPLVQSMVRNRIQEAGPILFSPMNRGEGIRKAVAVSPHEVIRTIKAARLRGRGGAGFPTGMKWEFTRAAPGARKFIVCNADEGEPGTFKDRVLLTELPDRVFAGLTIAGYALGASEGVLYLRGEYAYLLRFLEDVLEHRREDGLLGHDIAGRKGFDFDIRIQVGAGAYVCGEETALLNSIEGFRGDPRSRPPFPAQSGLFGCPTVVNNVETLSCVTKILEGGAASFCAYGTSQSTGTKLLSVSGDCRRPGTYELPLGITLGEVLERAGAVEPAAVQVGGPSGAMVGPEAFGRTISFDDLATGGAIVTFGPERDILGVVRAYTEFFADESCGYCTPCRSGNELLLRYLDRVLAGEAEPSDLEEMKRVATTMKIASRCGLGQTACNPVLSTLSTFPALYERAASVPANGRRRSFDLARATAPAAALRERARSEATE